MDEPEIVKELKVHPLVLESYTGLLSQMSRVRIPPRL